MESKYVLAKGRDCGVYAGHLQTENGNECTLVQARRLWYWKCALKEDGKRPHFLSGVATHGLDFSSKVSEPVSITLKGICEIIECTEKAKKSIKEIKSYEG